MKKMFSKVSAFVLAFMMIFALGACGDNNMVEVGSAGEALTGAADAMLGQDGITVTLDGSISMLGKLETVSLSNIGLSGSFKMAKKNNDIDFDASAAVKVGTMNMDFGAIKVGDTMYFNSFETGGEWLSETADPITLPNALPAQVTDMLKSFDLGKLEKGKDSYTLKAELDYGAPLVALQNFIETNKDKTLTEVLFPELNDTQRAELKTKLNALAEEENMALTVPQFIAKIDEILEFVKGSGEAKTVKGIVNSLCAEMGFASAKDLRDMLVKNVPALEQMLPAATAGQSVYDYVIALADDMTIGDLIEMIGSIIGGGESSGPISPNVPETATEEDGSQDTEQGGGMMTFYSMLVEALTNKTDKEHYSIPAVYDGVLELIVMGANNLPTEAMGYIEMLLGMITDSSVAAKMNEEELPIAWANLQKMVFGANKASVSVVLNGSDLTLRSINVTFKNDIKYKTSSTATEQLTKADININLTFAYGAVTVEAPAASEIAGSPSADIKMAA